MGDITKQQLKNIVFITAHNSGALNSGVRHQIDAFDFDTYERFLKLTLELRENADATGALGGGTKTAVYLREALEHLADILSK